MLQFTSVVDVLTVESFRIRLRQGAMQLQNMHMYFMLKMKTRTFASIRGLVRSFVRLCTAVGLLAVFLCGSMVMSVVYAMMVSVRDVYAVMCYANSLVITPLVDAVMITVIENVVQIIETFTDTCLGFTSLGTNAMFMVRNVFDIVLTSMCESKSIVNAGVSVRMRPVV